MNPIKTDDIYIDEFYNVYISEKIFDEIKNKLKEERNLDEEIRNKCVYVIIDDVKYYLYNFLKKILKIE